MEIKTNLRMMNSKNLWNGHFEMSIPDFIENYTHLIRVYRFCLITSIDSDRDLLHSRYITRELGDIMLACEGCGTSIMIPSQGFIDEPRILSLFHGFDEIWFFEQVPRILPAPLFSIVAPLEMDREVLEGLAEWMTSAGCKLGLGDGIGLNYVTTEEELARALMSDPLHMW